MVRRGRGMGGCSDVPGEDIVGDGGNVELIAQSQAECAHEGGFARANGSSGTLTLV